MEKEHLIKVTEHEYRIGGHYHIIKTGLLPNRILIRDFNDAKWDEVLTQILDTCEWEKENYIQDEQHLKDGKVAAYSLLYLNSRITLCKTNGMVVMLFDVNSDQQTVKEIKELFLSLKSEKSGTQNIGVIISRGPGLGVQTFEYSLPEHSLIEYLDSDSRDFHEKVTRQLDAKDGSGLYLMYGEPGTGKTSFIKDVISKTSKQALFISPFFTESLTSPDLISLLMDYPDSILVIEDAETVLMERKADNSSAVSNLLNLTDGFLADFLNLKIICTFNTELNTIDDALLREGRLKGMHEFTKIQPDRAQKIAEVLDRDIVVNKPMTLADICGSGVESMEYKPKNIGFNSGFDIEPPFKN